MEAQDFSAVIDALKLLKIAGGDIFNGGSDMSTAKQDVELRLNKLPDDCSVEDIQYHLYALEKVPRALEDAGINGTLTQEEAEARFDR